MKRHQGALVVAIAVLALVPILAYVSHQAWLDNVAQYVSTQKDLYKGQGNFDLYLSELQRARQAAGQGDWIDTYRTMNRFLEILDAREGGIPEKAARDIREHTYKVQPMAFHDAS